MRFLIVFLLAFACSSQSTTEPEQEKPDKLTKPDPFEQNALLGRGINLGNALEAPNEGDWGIVLQDEWFGIIADAGFNSVRIPVRWSAHAQETAPYTIDAAFLARVDWAVSKALENNLAVMLNIHHYEEIFAEPAAQKERYKAIWAQLAEHYAEHPTTVMWELLNEPHDNLTAELWNTLAAETVAMIRQIDTVHTLVIGTAEWGGVYGLDKLQLPDDDNLIVTVHYYEPFHFTHQGAEWVDGADAWLGTTWLGTSAEKSAVTEALSKAAAFSAANNVPLHIGEFGAYSKADMASRARWTSFVTRSAEALGLSWAYWEFAAGFGVYDKENKQWITQLRDALLP